MASVTALGRWLMTGVLVACFSCGDAMVPTGFEGAPVFQYEGFLIFGEVPSGTTRPVYALFWHPDGYASASWEDAVEQPGTQRRLVTVDVLTFNLFEHPAADLLAESQAGGRYGIGTLVAYDDRDGDSRFDQGEPVLAHGGQGLLYVPRALDARASPTDRRLPAGYHRVDVPLSCVPIRLGDEPCEVELGKACEGDGDCDEGSCLTRGYTTGVGQCVMRDPDGCEPEDGALTYELVDGADTPTMIDFVWFEACESQAQCGEQTGRYCDVALGACLPDQGLNLQLGRLAWDGPCNLEAVLLEEQDLEEREGLDEAECDEEKPEVECDEEKPEVECDEEKPEVECDEEKPEAECDEEKPEAECDEEKT